jgi:hypothetical protein
VAVNPSISQGSNAFLFAQLHCSHRSVRNRTYGELYLIDVIDVAPLLARPFGFSFWRPC